MDWSKVASTIGSTAPLLAGLLGGPVGLGVTTAASLLSHVLGTSNDPESIATALQDPSALDKVRQAESTNAVQLQQLAVTATQAQLAHEMELVRIAAEDRKDARAMSIATRDWVPKALAIAVTLGFFGILVLMALHALPDPNRDLVNVVIGSLGTAWISIIGYYFGTSAGSARKTELLAQPGTAATQGGETTPRESVPKRDVTSPQTPASPGGATHGEMFAPVLPGMQGPVFEN
jgi:hypothetical protein